MDKDRAKGSATNIGGKVKESAGKRPATRS